MYLEQTNELQVWVTQNSYCTIVLTCGWQLHAFVTEHQVLAQEAP